MTDAVTFEFYSQTYGGGLSESAFGLSLPAASRHVRWLVGSAVPSDDELEAYQRAVCAAADAFAEFGEGQVGGFSLWGLQGNPLRGGGHNRRGNRHRRRAQGACGDLAGVLRGAMMRALRPIPLRLLAEDAVVRVPDGDGGYAPRAWPCRTCSSPGCRTLWTTSIARQMLEAAKSMSTR